YHKVLPPTIGVTTPNPSCHFETSPFYINSETRPWVANPFDSSMPRRAGVSAFGFGGTNFHAVVEEYVPATGAPIAPASSRWSSELFILKGKTKNDLARALDVVADSADKWSRAENNTDALRMLSYTTYLKQLERPETAENKELLTVALVATSLTDLVEKAQKAKQEIADKDEIRDPKG